MAALAELSVWALALVCLGIAALITVLVVALFEWLINLLNSVPTVNIGTGWLHTTERAILDALGTAFGKVNAVMGASLHLMARYTDELWKEIEAQAHLAWAQTEVLAGHIYDVTGLRQAVHSLTHTFRGIEHGVKDLEHWALREERRVKRLEHALFHGIGEDVLPRLKTLEHEYEHIQNKELKAIRREWATTEAEVRNLYDFLRGKASLIGVGTFAFAIAATIGADVFRGLSCKELGNFFRKFGCGVGTLLNDLLGLVIAGLVLESVCEFLPYFEDAFGAVVGPMTHLLTEVPLGSCEKIPKDWATLSVAAGPLPPAQRLGAFPS